MLALCQLAGPFSGFFSSLLFGMLGRTEVVDDLSSGADFQGGRFLDFWGSLKLLSSSHLRGGDEGLLRGVLAGCVWNGFLLSCARKKLFLAVFAVVLKVTVICFGKCPPLLFTFVKILSFTK